MMPPNHVQRLTRPSRSDCKRGYDPIKLKTKKGLGFQKHAREFFHPLEVNEVVANIAVCSSRDTRSDYVRRA